MQMLRPPLSYLMTGIMELECGQRRPVHSPVTSWATLTRRIPPKIRPGNLAKIKDERSGPYGI